MVSPHPGPSVVLRAEGSATGLRRAIEKGSILRIPPGVVHGALGRMRVLVVGIPDMTEGDLVFPEEDTD